MSSARSTLGDDERSSRAPARPSITQRNPAPSNGTEKQVSNAVKSSTGRVHDAPPSKDRIRMCLPAPGVPTANWFAKTYTTPSSSVRIVQPERPNPFFGLNGLFVASVTCLSAQVSPPSVDRATISGVGAAFPPLRLRNEAQHTYALPKNGLTSSWSTQICSLSLKVVEDCLLATTGAIQLSCSATTSGAVSSFTEAGRSRRETPNATYPLNVAVPGKWLARFA